MTHPGAAAGAAHRAAVEAQRAAREAGLRDPMGWLSLVGLHWLAPGSRSFGSAEDNDVVLRAEEGDVPAVAGRLDVADGRVVVEAGAPALTIRGAPITEPTELLDDHAETPTVLELASLRIVLIRRGAGRQALRVRDVAAPTLRSFEGLPFFEVDERWRLQGRFVRAEPGATIRVPDIVGNQADEPTPGDVEFEVGGRTHRLRALEEGSDRLWLVFGDRTNGDQTYGGGRFLVTGPVAPDGTLEIDFNLAYNPPCVFSPYATCPMVPPGNQLDLPIEAGERLWKPRG